MDRVARIKNHFNDEAAEFDGLILKLIPYYGQMIEALVNIIPFGKEDIFNLIDLGSGTGTVSRAIKNKFINCRMTLVDISEKMISISKNKLSSFSDAEFITCDLNSFEFPGKYDVIVSSLALHHLETDADKIIFFGKISDTLNPGGIFYNADVILASDEHSNSVYMEKWKEYMSQSVPMEEIESKWLVNYRNEDRPAKLVDQLRWLENAGFKNIDVVWKYYNFAVYGGKK